MLIDREIIESASQQAFTRLSQQRKYQVAPGDCVCAFIAPLVANILSECGVVAEVQQQKLIDGSSNWLVRVREADDYVDIDATWWSMLTSEMIQGLPAILLISSDGSAFGISDERIPDDILHHYFGQRL